MEKPEREKFINELVESVRKSILKENEKYPDVWNGIELRWRIKEIFAQVVFGGGLDKRKARYKDYYNTVLIEGLL